MKHFNMVILSSMVAGSWFMGCSKLKPQSSTSKSTADVSISNGKYVVNFQLPEKLNGSIPKVVFGDVNLLKIADTTDGCDPAEIEGCLTANSNKPEDPTSGGVAANNSKKPEDPTSGGVASNSSKKPDDPTNGGIAFVVPGKDPESPTDGPVPEDPTRGGGDPFGVIPVDPSKSYVRISIPVEKAPQSFVDALNKPATALSSSGDPCNDPSCGSDGGAVKGTIDLKVHYEKSSSASLGLSESTKEVKVFDVKANVGKK